MTTVTYPESGAVVTNTWDSMGRLNKVNNAGTDWASNAVYGPAGELLSLAHGSKSETRTYNTLASYPF